MKILLVEDDVSINRALVTSLKSTAVVTVATTTRRAKELLFLNHYDLAILDVNLPDGNGFELCSHIRSEGLSFPVLILTAEEDVSQKITGFTSGADDYLTKPFHIQELKLRIAALARRSPTTQSDLLTAQDLTLDVRRCVVIREGREVPLRPKLCAILEYLLRHKNEVVRRTELLEHVWPDSADPLSNTVDVHIKHLRDRIDKPFAKHTIRTVPATGYIIDD
jgi:two-component system copper resistance phosphate regulon response regulator CusR